MKKTFHHRPPLLPVWLGRRLLMPILLASLGCIGSPSIGKGLGTERIDLTINGMVCSFCVQGVERKIRGLPATQNVKIDLSKRVVQVWVRHGETIQDDQLRKLIRDAGFDVREIKRINVSP